MSSRRAKAHAQRHYYCTCGAVLAGNGARARHFYVEGKKLLGLREGHERISKDEYDRLHPDE